MGKEMGTMKWVKGFAFLLLGIALLVSGCSTVAQSKAPEQPEVTLKEYSIGSSEIRLPVSDKPVRLTIKNKGTSPHDFVVKELGIDTGILKPGESVTIEMKAQDAGTYQAVCSLPGHAEAGMAAKVIVSK